MTRRRMPRRNRSNGRFINRQRGRNNVPKAEAPKPIITHPQQWVSEASQVAATDDRPACFGNCYELSSACNACSVYNACRRASQ